MKLYAAFNRFEIEMPLECARDCSGPGPADDAVEYWQDQLSLGLSRADMIAELSEYGAWDDLETDSTDLLEQRLIWLGACNLYVENGSV